MSGQGTSRWRFAVLPLIVASVTVAPRLIERYFADVTPAALLVVAAALLAIGIAVGIHTWRHAKAHNA